MAKPRVQAAPEPGDAAASLHTPLAPAALSALRQRNCTGMTPECLSTHLPLTYAYGPSYKCAGVLHCCQDTGSAPTRMGEKKPLHRRLDHERSPRPTHPALPRRATSRWVCTRHHQAGELRGGHGPPNPPGPPPEGAARSACRAPRGSGEPPPAKAAASGPGRRGPPSCGRAPGTFLPSALGDARGLRVGSHMSSPLSHP